jgi:hypothetical protein
MVNIPVKSNAQVQWSAPRLLRRKPTEGLFTSYYGGSQEEEIPNTKYHIPTYLQSETTNRSGSSHASQVQANTKAKSEAGGRIKTS